ncbi:MAG: hypothetical protein KDC92_17965 [Bacteroidetes bacterium]|nr:hypothetical protein [Bacteroidota bacterium]
MKEIVKIPTEYGEKIKSVLVMVLGFVILGTLLAAKKPELGKTLLYVGIGAGVLSLLSKFVLDKIIWLWFSLASVMGFIMSKVLLTVVFYVFLFPVALLSRIGKKNSLQLKRPQQTTFIERNHTYTKDDLENIW